MNGGIELGKSILYLTRDEVVGLGITRKEALTHVNTAMVEHGHKEYEMPAKIGVHPYEDVFFHAMPAYLKRLGIVGQKWIECYPRNPEEFSLPQTTGLLTINHVDSGVPLAIMDCTWVTAMRTPAVTALSAAVMNPDATSYAQFGCGVQGREHVYFMLEALPKLETITVYDRDQSRADAVVAEVSKVSDAKIARGDSLEAMTKEHEVLSSATLILKKSLAFIKDEWIGPGQLVLPVDLVTFFDARTPARADKFFLDSTDEHVLFDQAGYFPLGLPEITAETGEVLAGLKPGRTSPDELIVVSNTGMAVTDITLGKYVLDQAIEAGVGTILPL